MNLSELINDAHEGIALVLNGKHRAVALFADSGSDCRFLETSGEDNCAYVYVSLWPLPVGVGLSVATERDHDWRWFHRTGKY